MAGAHWIRHLFMCKLIVSTMLLVVVTQFPGCSQPYSQVIKAFGGVSLSTLHWAALLGFLFHYSLFSSFKFLLICIKVLPSKAVLLHRQDRGSFNAIDNIFCSCVSPQLLIMSPVFFSYSQSIRLGYFSTL